MKSIIIYSNGTRMVGRHENIDEWSMEVIAKDINGEIQH